MDLKTSIWDLKSPGWLMLQCGSLTTLTKYNLLQIANALSSPIGLCALFLALKVRPSYAGWNDTPPEMDGISTLAQGMPGDTHGQLIAREVVRIRWELKCNN